MYPANTLLSGRKRTTAGQLARCWARMGCYPDRVCSWFCAKDCCTVAPTLASMFRICRCVFKSQSGPIGTSRVEGWPMRIGRCLPVSVLMPPLLPSRAASMKWNVAALGTKGRGRLPGGVYSSRRITVYRYLGSARGPGIQSFCSINPKTAPAHGRRQREREGCDWSLGQVAPHQKEP